MRFITRPVVVHAEQFLVADLNTHSRVNFGYPKTDDQSAHWLDGQYWVQAVHGPQIIADRDWIVVAANGQIAAYTPDRFTAIYDPAPVKDQETTE